MLKIVMERKMKYTIFFLFFLLILAIFVSASQTHPITQVSRNYPDRTRVDVSNNLIFDESDEAHIIQVSKLKDYPNRCPAGELAIGIKSNGEFYCQSVAIRCGAPHSASEQFCLIEDKTNDWR